MPGTSEQQWKKMVLSEQRDAQAILALVDYRLSELDRQMREITQTIQALREVMHTVHRLETACERYQGALYEGNGHEPLLNRVASLEDSHKRQHERWQGLSTRLWSFGISLAAAAACGFAATWWRFAVAMQHLGGK